MNNEANITCPKCGADIPLTEAVSHRLREQLTADFEKERKTMNAVLAEREEKLAAEQVKFEGRQLALQTEVARQVEAERKKLVAEAARLAEEKVGTQVKDLQNELAEKQTKLKEAQTAELDLRRKQRELEEAKANLELDMTRKLDAERKKIAEDAGQRVVEAERLKLADKENIIKGLQSQISALQQRAEQGSMQLQGETLELELENMLRSAFPYDEIEEVKKGQRGADIEQRVRTSAGVDCGAILWEAKRAQNWSDEWPEKLKEDQREAKVELAVLITTCPPKSIRGIGQTNGVWVCEPPFATAIAAALRQGLVSTTAQRLQGTNRADKMSRLYEYLCGMEFRQHVEAVVEAFKGMQEQLVDEKRAFAKQWKEREQQIQKAIQHTAMLYGGVQGIAGRDALPEIEPLQLPGTI